MGFLAKIGRRWVVASLEGDLVKVLYVSLTGRRMVVEKALTFGDDEFDGFLATCRDREFIVVSTFPIFYQDVLSLPPAKEKYFPTLVEMAVRKGFVGAGDLLFFYDILGDVQQDGRKTRETFAFAVEYTQVGDIVERFDRYGKTVTAVYPSVFTLAVLLGDLAGMKEEIILAVLDTGTGKTLFLLKEGRLRFVRFVTSDERGIHAADIDNINMTIGYFRQTFRLSPSRIVFLNSEEPEEEAPRLVVPHILLDEIPDVSAAGQDIMRYIVPISASITPQSTLKQGNLLSPAVKTLPVQKRILTAATVLLLMAALGATGSVALSLHRATHAKNRITELQQEIARKEPVFRESETADSELQTVSPLIAYVNKAHSSADLTKLIADLGFFPVERVAPQSMLFEVKEDGLAIEIKGFIKAETFAEMETRYRDLIKKLGAVKGLKMTADQIEPKDMSFSIEAKWKI